MAVEHTQRPERLERPWIAPPLLARALVERWGAEGLIWLDGDGTPLACLHPERQHRDWLPMTSGDPLFLQPGGEVISYKPSEELEELAGRGGVVPLFINEAAYGEKGIALSLTERQVMACEPGWAEALMALAAGLAQSAC